MHQLRKRLKTSYVSDEELGAHRVEWPGGKWQEAFSACGLDVVAAQVRHDEALILAVSNKHPRSLGIIICDVHRLALVGHVESEGHFQRAWINEGDGAVTAIGDHHEAAKDM